MEIARKMTTSRKELNEEKKLMKTLNLIDRQNELIKSTTKRPMRTGKGGRSVTNSRQFFSLIVTLFLLDD